MNKKKVLITGISGMDGSHLAELLLEKDYEVHGIIRRSSSKNTGRIDHIFDKLKLHYGDVTDYVSISNVINEVKPNELYNLAAQSHVQVSFEVPQYTGQVDAIGTLNILEGIKSYSPKTKCYNATTSELYGGMDYNRSEKGYNEESPFHPRSPYGVAKLYSYWIAKNYRESYNMFISNGILFNHSGERRGHNFVEKKIVDSLVRIKLGSDEILSLGNLYSKRDIGYSKEYVEGMWRMLQYHEPEDFVLATNKTFTIKEMVEMSCVYLNLPLKWEGEGINEKGISNGKTIIKIDEKYFRPAEVDLLIGDYSKANNLLGWKPKILLSDLIKIMIDSELKQ
jgi:GDPmannose 4,6-dehydratase